MAKKKKTTKKKRKSQYEAYERYIFSALRKIFGWTKKKGALAKGKLGINKYQCIKCSTNLALKEVQVDHITPCMPITGWDKDWSGYINRMFHGDTQILCKDCHKAKTGAERKLRKEAKEKK